MQRMPILIACAATLAALGGAGIGMSRSEIARGSAQDVLSEVAIAPPVEQQLPGASLDPQTDGVDLSSSVTQQGITQQSIYPQPISQQPISQQPTGQNQLQFTQSSSVEPEGATSIAADSDSVVDTIGPLPDVIRRLARKAQAEPAQPYQPQSVVIRDEIIPGSDFARFRNQLRAAVRDRDANFLRQVAHDHIKLSFGRGITLEQRLADPDTALWQELERAIGGDCASDSNAPGDDYWACPASFVVEAYHPEIDPYLTVYVNGTDVAVRQLPSVNSPVLTRVSNRILQSVSLPWDESLSEAEDAQLNAWYKASETDQGWKFVSLPDGRKGFVSSRYAYSALGYRAIFQRDEINGWVMTAFIAGD